ncbi:hypothetical protein CFREI_09725 [Corynebacterium freiburgense]|nr:hypothetical protein CFREI_09725 [Corynebacterium freiburgense]
MSPVCAREIVDSIGWELFHAHTDQLNSRIGNRLVHISVWSGM